MEVFGMILFLGVLVKVLAKKGFLHGKRNAHKIDFSAKQTRPKENDAQDTEKIYQELTGVDIRQQKAIWDERGRGYYGEFLVFKELYKAIPGYSKFLMNLQIPTANGKTTEIDLLMIDETGLYVFEIKHYKGHIYGKASENNWTQYFRTAPNQSFLNPVKQNEYHVSALKTLFPYVEISSVVVFTNSDCTLKVENDSQTVKICYLANLDHTVHQLRSNMCEKTDIKYTPEQIDEMFCRLMPYAPNTDTKVKVDGAVMTLYQYLDLLSAEFKTSVKKNKAEAEAAVKKKVIGVIAGALAVVVAAVGTGVYAYGEKIAAEEALDQFSHRFEHVEDLQTDVMVYSNDLVTVENLVLKASDEVRNAVEISCTLNGHGTEYGVAIGEKAMILVQLKDRTVKEYDLWNEKYPYRASDVRLGKKWIPKSTVGLHVLHDLCIDDIEYIKLSNLGIVTTINYTPKVIAEGYEIELYDSLNTIPG